MIEFQTVRDALFDNIVEQIRIKNNENYQCEVLKEIINKEISIKFLELRCNTTISKSFIITNNDDNLTGKKIQFETNVLKIKIINNKAYFLITEYTLIDNDNNKTKIQNILMNSSSDYKIITSMKEIKPNSLYSLILKAKEIKVKTQQYKIQFEDLDMNTINISEPENSEFEHGKIYYFHGFIYNSLLSIFEPTKISYIEKFSPSTLKINSSKEIFEYEVNSLLNFKGKVKTFNIKNNTIIIENEDGIFNINANYNLLKQLALNVECKFYNFIKHNNEEFISSNLSIIEANEETFIEFNFPFYDIEKKYYNKIKINNKYYDINDKTIKIRIEDEEKANLFLQEVSYEKVEKEQSLECYTFILELNKGKIYHLDSSLEKNGFSYEFYIQSNNEINLPQVLKVQYKNEIKIIKNKDKNGNKLKERFTIINFPKQDINKVLDLYGLPESGDENKKDDEHNFKYFLLIDSDNKKTLKKFEIEKVDKQKKNFLIPGKTEIALEKASKQCFINFNENNKDKLYNIDLEDVTIFKELMYKLFDGFRNYKFENTKRQYNIIKNITSFCINYCGDNLLGKYYSFRKNYEILLDSMVTLEYIDRIKILISFMIKIIDIVDGKNLCYDMFNLIDIDNVNSYEMFPYVKNAFDIFYEIIDNLTEDCALFQVIDQFNSLIYKDVISGENQHSGSILNLNDIKLELVKNINRFIFLSEKSYYDCNEYANFETSGLLVTFNLFSFFRDIDNIYNENYYKKATSAILFLLFHECFGHQKKNINNESIITPRMHYDNNFKYFSSEKEDTGLALEIILLEKAVNIKYLMNSDNSEKLLSPQLYTGKDFNKLKEIYDSIEKDNYNNNTKKDLEKKDDLNSTSNKKSQSPGKNIIIKNQTHLMYEELYMLYRNVSDDRKEEYKDDENYQRFIMMYEKKHKNPSEYLRLPDKHYRRYPYKK